MTVDGEPVDNVAEGIGAALGDVAVGFGKRVKDRILKKDENPDEPQEGLAFTPEETDPATTDSKSSERKEYSLTSVLGFISILTGVLAVGIGVGGFTLGGNKALAGFTIVIALVGAFLQAPIILGVALGIVILAGLGGLGWTQ